MFGSLKTMADSLATIASRLDRISRAIEDLVDLQYREAGVVRTPTVLPPLPPDKEHTQVMYASDTASFEAEQQDRDQQPPEAMH